MSVPQKDPKLLRLLKQLENVEKILKDPVHPSNFSASGRAYLLSKKNSFLLKLMRYRKSSKRKIAETTQKDRVAPT